MGEQEPRSPSTRRNRLVLAVAVAVAVVLLAVPAWVVHQQLGVRAVHQHAVFEVFEAFGWEVTHDRRFRAGPFDQLFLGGMIEHPIQREAHYAPEETRGGVLTVLVEDALFGVRGQTEVVALGLRWERRLVGASGVQYTARDASARGRLDMVTVSVSPGAVHVRTFGR
jgi:catechol 2,3-dioxygenase-like lactoylglutathione lyase family enzyme